MPARPHLLHEFQAQQRVCGQADAARQEQGPQCEHGGEADDGPHAAVGGRHARPRAVAFCGRALGFGGGGVVAALGPPATAVCVVVHEGEGGGDDEEDEAPAVEEAGEGDQPAHAVAVADVRVAKFLRVEGEEDDVGDGEAQVLAHRVAGGRVAHVFPRQNGQRPPVHRDVLRGPPAGSEARDQRRQGRPAPGWPQKSRGRGRRR